MPQLSREQKIIQEAYRAVLSTEQGRIVLDDLVRFAQLETGEPRALGRSDVVLRFMRERTRAGIKDEGENQE